MEVPRLGVKLELLLLAYTTANSNRGSRLHLRPTPRQRRILNSLSEARDRTRVLMDPSQICFCCTTTGTLVLVFDIGYLSVTPPLFQSLEPLPASGPDFGGLGEEAEFVEVEPEAKQEILENKDVSLPLRAP